MFDPRARILGVCTSLGQQTSLLVGGLCVIHRMLRSSDPEQGKICYQKAGFLCPLGLGSSQGVGSLASDQEGHVLGSVWFGLVWW
jgi:hypothetical protein